MKRILALILSIIILAATCLPLNASAMITSYSGVLTNLPGNTRSASPDYSYAWLDNVIIRHDVRAVTSTAMTPSPEDYPYSHTYDEFIKEASQYSTLFYLDENTATAAYKELSTVLYYVVTALGMTDKQENMRAYLIEQGIKLPPNETAEDKMAIAVVYAAIKYDAVYTLYEKKVTFPRGVTLDSAMVIILSALTNTPLPSSVNTLTGLAVLVLKNYVTQFEQLPISENPGPSEVFHWTKIVTAAANEYSVPLASYGEATTAQKEYADYAYYASILKTIYDININPIYLVIALQSSDELALQKLILTTMLSEKKVAYSKDASCKELFDLACKSGYFTLEDEFYSDVFTYKITVPASCEKVWFTPFSLASQLDGGDEKFVSLKLNDTPMAINSTVSADFDKSKSTENILLSVNYNDGKTNESVTYKFVVIKDAALDDPSQIVADNDMVAEVEKFVDTIIPNGSSAANETIDKIFSSIDSVASDVLPSGQSVLTTYGVGNIEVPDVTYNLNTTAPSQNQTTTGSRFDFDYLEDLINGVYVTDANGNIITTNSLSDNDDNKEPNVIQKAVTTVKEKPEIVAAPSSLLAAGLFAGYLLTKKHKDQEPEKDDETDSRE